MARIERATSPLPRECSTTEPHGRFDSGMRLPSQATVDPVSKGLQRALSKLERETGIEPASLAWKARVLPLNYSRSGASRQLRAGARSRREIDTSNKLRHGGGGWIRTSVGVSQQIYSLPPLATRAPLRGEPQSITAWRRASTANDKGHPKETGWDAKSRPTPSIARRMRATRQRRALHLPA